MCPVELVNPECPYRSSWNSSSFFGLITLEIQKLFFFQLTRYYIFMQLHYYYYFFLYPNRSMLTFMSFMARNLKLFVFMNFCSLFDLWHWLFFELHENFSIIIFTFLAFEVICLNEFLFSVLFVTLIILWIARNFFIIILCYNLFS